MGWQLGGKGGLESDWKGAETRPLNGRLRWPEIAGGDGAREPSSCFPEGGPTPELLAGDGKEERGAVLVLRAKSPQGFAVLGQASTGSACLLEGRI